MTMTTEELEQIKRWEKHWINFERDFRIPKTEDLEVIDPFRGLKRRYKRS
jgi:hypothetical protein